MSRETTEAETAAELGRVLDRLRANQREIERTLRALSDVDRRRLWLLCVDTAARADISPRVRDHVERTARVIDAIDFGTDMRAAVLRVADRELFDTFTDYLMST